MDLLYRKHEGVTLLCQNNKEGSVRIFGLNDVMEEMTGFHEEEVKGEPFALLLGEKHADILEDYIEYENDANDLSQVIGKMRDLKLRHKEGHLVPVEGFKLVRIEAKDRHHWFRLIVEDMVHKREIEAFKKILSENFKGHEVIDEESGLPDKASIRKDLELSQYYADTKGLNAFFAYMRVDDFAEIALKHGKTGALAALAHVANNLRRNLRADDTIGRVDDDAIGVILMDIDPDSARIVINRLRWLIGAEELKLGIAKRRNITVSVAFAMIGAGGSTDLPERCAALLADQSAGSSQLASLG